MKANKRRIVQVVAFTLGWVIVMTSGHDLASARDREVQTGEWANVHDREREDTYASREADWRNGAVVYQVIVDRFAPPSDLDSKRSLYPAPKRLMKWTEEPTHGELIPEQKVHRHEIDFWGGDLASLMAKLDYIDALRADVLYLNPIHKAYTNHKYDAEDYFAVSPEYGTREDVKNLAHACRERGMKFVLDGVFNHMGRRATWFQEAMGDPQSAKRDWFFIGDQYKAGYRAWADVANLPELRLENPEVRQAIFGADDSVVQGYLRDGVDGWRLDVAFDIGFVFLDELTQAAHRAKPGSLVVGEIWNYPEEWSPAVDAVMNFYTREIIYSLVDGKVSGAQAGRMIDCMVQDAGIEPILKSWLVLDNHDTQRLATQLPDKWRQRMAQVLQFTLPGSPCVYYGVEVGMEGGDDPYQRAPMRWDLVTDDNESYQWMKKLIAMRQDNRALRIGDFRLLPTEDLLVFLRRTDRVEETTVIVANPSDKRVTEFFPVRDSKLMNGMDFCDALSGAKMKVLSGTTRISVEPRSIHVFRPEIKKTSEYSSFKRVQ